MPVCSDRKIDGMIWLRRALFSQAPAGAGSHPVVIFFINAKLVGDLADHTGQTSPCCLIHIDLRHLSKVLLVICHQYLPVCLCVWTELSFCCPSGRASGQLVNALTWRLTAQEQEGSDSGNIPGRDHPRPWNTAVLFRPFLVLYVVLLVGRRKASVWKYPCLWTLQ